jgi:hypothetical protein
VTTGDPGFCKVTLGFVRSTDRYAGAFGVEATRTRAIDGGTTFAMLAGSREFPAQKRNVSPLASRYTAGEVRALAWFRSFASGASE